MCGSPLSFTQTPFIRAVRNVETLVFLKNRFLVLGTLVVLSGCGSGGLSKLFDPDRMAAPRVSATGTPAPGSASPSASPSPSASAVPTPTPSPSPSAAPTATPSAVGTPTPSPTATPQLVNVSGSVVDSVTGAPLFNVFVRFTAASGFTYIAFTDVSGNYSVAGIPVGSYTLNSVIVGYVQYTSSITLSGSIALPPIRLVHT